MGLFVHPLLAFLLALLVAGAPVHAEDDESPGTGSQAESEKEPDATLPAAEDEGEAEVEGAEGGTLRMTPTEGVEEITITGEVLESSTQAEPEAITTFDQEELDTLGIATVDTLALNTPSLHVGQVGQQAVITLRGIGLENLTSVGEAGVGFEIDGVHLGRPSAANAAFFDLERIDVLRGPQGYQGGRQTNAGRIALVSKKPEEDLNAFGDVTYGNYNHIQTRGVLNVPVTGVIARSIDQPGAWWADSLMTRTSLLLDRHTGYQEHLFTGVNGKNGDDSKDLAARVQTRSLFFDQTFEARTILTYTSQDGNGPGLKLIGPPPDNIDNSVALIKRIASRQLDNGPEGAAYAQDVLNVRTRLDGRPLCTAPPIPLQEAHPDGPTFDPSVCNPGSRKSFQDIQPDRDNRQKGITTHLSWDVPYFADSAASDLQVKFLYSWMQIKAADTQDFDGTNIPDSFFWTKRTSKQHVMEGFIERPDVDWWDFKLGGYYYREDIDSHVCFDSTSATSTFDLAFQGDIETKSWAGYLDLGFRPIDNVRVFGAVRYTNEEKWANQIIERYEAAAAGQLNRVISTNGGTLASQRGCGRTFRDPLGYPTVPSQTRGGWLVIDEGRSLNGCMDENNNGMYEPEECNPIKQNDTYTAWTPRFAIEWQVNDASSLSFNATRGFKAGGFPLAAEATLNPELQIPYPSEKVWNFELDSKNDLFDGLVRLNIAAFWTEYNPFQICQFAGPIFFCRADGSATIRGIEIEGTANPIEGLQLNGHFNYIDTRVNNFQIIDPTTRSCSEWLNPVRIQECEEGLRQPLAPSPALPVDVSGNQLPKAPQWAGSFGVQYTLDLGRWGYLTPRAQTQFQGRTYFRVFNKDEFSQDPYVKADFKIMWRSENDRFSAEAFVYNAFDEDVINSMVVGPQATGGQVLAQYQAPRLYGLKFQVNYTSDLLEDLY